MANIKSQIKRNRQNEKRRLRNKSVKSSLKTAIRKFNEAREAGDAETATALLRDASRKLDKAVSKGVIHKNQAANRKSAIAKRVARCPPDLTLTAQPGLAPEPRRRYGAGPVPRASQPCGRAADSSRPRSASARGRSGSRPAGRAGCSALTACPLAGSAARRAPGRRDPP